MAAGTVISGGFPGRVAQEVTPNPKCHGCLHYDGQAGRTGACTIGLRPWLCGDGEVAEIGYAPIARGAGTYLPDMTNKESQAREVETQFVSDLYGSGSTKPVTVTTVSLGGEAVDFIKSMVDQHMDFERSMCRLCKSAGTTIGATPFTNAPQVCTCEPIKATDVAKALVGRMTNRQRVAMSLGDVTQFVYDVAKAGYKMPKPDVAKAAESSVAMPHGTYHIKQAGETNLGMTHKVTFHPKEGAPKAVGGVHGSRMAAKQAITQHAASFSKGYISAEKLDKSYTDDWLCQFKGTPLFKLAHQLCEQELAQTEAQLKRREDRQKHDKARSAALAKLRGPEESYDWQEDDNLRQRLQIAKQRLSLKLAEHQAKKMAG